MSVEAINAKKVVVEEITGKFNDSQSAVVVEYRGLSVAEVTELRKLNLEPWSQAAIDYMH